MFELGRRHLFHRLFDPANCVPQVLQSGDQGRLSVYRQKKQVQRTVVDQNKHLEAAIKTVSNYVEKSH